MKFNLNKINIKLMFSTKLTLNKFKQTNDIALNNTRDLNMFA